MQKALTQMNVQLANVISDVVGETGQRILRAIVAGERDGQVLALMKDVRIRASGDEIAKSLRGNWRPEHVFSLQQALAMFDFIGTQVAECDREIAQQLQGLQTHDGEPAKSKKRNNARNAPKGDLRTQLFKMCGVDLTRIDGINVTTALAVLSETGTDMSRFPTVGHFTSWLGLCPGTKITGDKVMSGKTKRAAKRAAQAFRVVPTEFAIVGAIMPKNNTCPQRHRFPKGFPLGYSLSAARKAIIVQVHHAKMLMTVHCPRPIRYDVFLSYRHDLGGSLARLIKEKLAGRGFSIFLDHDDLRQCEDFHEKLRITIQNCHNFVLLLTSGSLERCNADPKDYCRREIEEAIRAERRIILVAENEKLDLSSEAFPLSIRPVSNLNAVIHNNKYFDAFIEELVSRLDCSSTKTEAASEWRKIEDTLTSAAYRHWQCAYLYELYRPQVSDDVPMYAGARQPDFFPSIADTRYPIVCYRAARPDLLFAHEQINSEPPEFRDPQELPDLNASPQIPIPDWVLAGECGELRARYFELLSYTRRVRRWNMRGFALAGLTLDGNNQVAEYKARLCTYGENCLTSHVLGFALCKQFQERDATPAPQYDRVLRPITSLLDSVVEPRRALHLSSEEPFFPLISVQGLVVTRDAPGSKGWQILAMERSGKVASAPGFWQFPPAGGFEIYGTENENRLHIKKQFDMRLALIREFLEEIFGDIDMTCENQEGARAGHEGSEGFQQISASLDQGLTSIHFLGVVADLVSLRAEFSFLIVVQDPRIFGLSYLVNDPTEGQRIAKWKCGSDESKRIHSLAFEEVRHILSDPCVPCNPSSAGLIKLFMESTQDPQGWLKTLYPTMPTLVL